MGTITRSFANNITTSGVLLPASLTNNSIANVTAYNASVATGGMKLISTQTASNSASISFTTGIDSTYKEYQFWFDNIHSRHSTYTDFTFNLSTDSGSNYNVAKTGTLFYSYHSEDDSQSGLNYDTGRDVNQSTGYAPLLGDSSPDSDASMSGSMSLFNPSSTTYVKHYMANINNYRFNGFSMNFFVSGYGNTTSAINAINFKFTDGNMDGTILMYGIV
jgi:hypothetical protein